MILVICDSDRRFAVLIHLHESPSWFDPTHYFSTLLILNSANKNQLMVNPAVLRGNSKIKEPAIELV